MDFQMTLGWFVLGWFIMGMLTGYIVTQCFVQRRLDHIQKRALDRDKLWQTLHAADQKHTLTYLAQLADLHAALQSRCDAAGIDAHGTPVQPEDVGLDKPGASVDVKFDAEHARQVHAKRAYAERRAADSVQSMA